MKDAFEEIDLKGYSEIPYDQLDVLLEHADSDIFVQSFLKNMSSIYEDDHDKDMFFIHTVDYTILPPGELEYHKKYFAYDELQPLYLPYKENEYKMYMALFEWQGLVVMEYDENCKDLVDYTNKYAKLRSKYTNEFIANEDTVLERIEQLQEMKFNNKKELINAIKKQYEEHPKYIDVTDWDVSNVKDMSYLFHDLEYLEQIIGLDTWDTSNVKDMEGMFEYCYKLKEIKGLDTWDVSNATDMSWMFYNCPLQNKYGTDGEKLLEQKQDMKQTKEMKM